MKNYFFLLLIVFLSSCSDCNIKSLEHEEVKFKDLPVEIVNYLKNPTDQQNDIQSMLIELPKGTENSYRLETVNTWIGPWVAYEKLLDIDKKKSYRIDQGIPGPYIVFDNKLYVPDRYNLFTTVNDLNSVVFTRYDLSDLGDRGGPGSK